MEQNQTRRSERAQRPPSALSPGILGGQTATVRSDPYEEPLPVVGMTVAQVRDRYGQLLDIDPGAEALVNGNEVGENAVIEEGQRLQFARSGGEKGSSAACSEVPA